MAGTIGGKVALDGEKQFKQSIRDINNEFRVMKSELKAVSTEFTRNNKTIGDAKKENKELEKNIDQLNKRLAEQEKGLKNATENFGEADKRTLKWKEEIAKTKTEINQFNNRIKDNDIYIQRAKDSTKKASDETLLFGHSMQETGKKAVSFGTVLMANLASEAIVGGVKLLGNAIKGLGNQMAGMIKQSVASFAEYEQLIGGVETLFKDSADEVQKYANNAYKTAGLNANQYMEQVTSFSASLLQSLNGDTAESAKIADIAITDMADNANKMGTSMVDIQNAYQGFAKHNYTMLDNLKLGYGGTKGEMERLLADAEKLSGTKYDISNLSDVYKAINVVQTELGITGTTAKEASQTISGSLSAAKSAWSNFVTGLANDNADLKQLSDEVINSAMIALDNLLPVVETVIDSLVDMIPLFTDKLIELLPQAIDFITEKLPVFVESGISILTSLMDGVLEASPLLFEAGIDVMLGLIEKITEMLPDIIEMGIEILLSMIEGIAQSIPELIPVIVDAVLQIIDTLIDNIDLLVDAGIEILFALIDGIIIALPRLIGKFPEIIISIVGAIGRNLPKILKAGWELLVKLLEGIISGIPKIPGYMLQVATKLINAILNTNWFKVGADILSGIGSGIINSVGSWASNVGGKIMSGIKGFFGIKSPSTLFRDQVGKYMADGLGVGFEKEMDKISDSMYDAVPTDFSVNGTVSTNINGAMGGDKLDQLISLTQQLLNKDQSLYLDGNKLVGGTVKQYDQAMGNLVAIRGR